MATISGGVCNNYIHIDLIVTERANSANIESNTSIVDWKLVGWYGHNTNAFWYANTNHAISVNINGATVYTRPNTDGTLINIGLNAPQNNPFVIASGSVTVPHNADGTKTVACNFSVAYRWASTIKWSGSGNLALTTIPRATVPVLSDSSVLIGGALKITANGASSSFKHTLKYVFGSLSGTIATNLSGAQSWTIPSLFHAQIPNAKSGTGKIICETYNSSGTLIGKKEVAVTFIARTQAPNATAIYSEGGNVPSTWGVYVQGKSKIRLGITATAFNSATIRSCYTTVDGAIYNGSSFVTGTITRTGNIPISTTVTDSRGNRSEIVFSSVPNVLEYSSPRITSVSTYRCDSNGTKNDSGAYMRVAVSGEIKALSNKNGRVLKIQYKKTSASTYTDKAITISAYNFTASSVIAIETNSSYDVRVVLSDTFESTTYVAQRVPSAYAFMRVKEDSNGKKVAVSFGKEIETDAFDVAWDAILRKTLKVYGNETVDGYINTSKGMYINSVQFPSSSNSTAGWMKMARIKITDSYVDYPVEIAISHRVYAGATDVSRVIFAFYGVDNADPDISLFVCKGSFARFKIKKASTSNWDLYMQKVAWDAYSVLDVKNSNMAINIDFVAEFQTSDPGGTEAVARLDGVQEQGASGMWAYKKYIDGTAECHGNKSVSGVNVDQAWGGMYASATKILADNYPFAFTEVPVVNYSFTPTSGQNAWICSATELGSATTSRPIGVQLIRPTTASGMAGYVSFIVKGKWK